LHAMQVRYQLRHSPAISSKSQPYLIKWPSSKSMPQIVAFHTFTLSGRF